MPLKLYLTGVATSLLTSGRLCRQNRRVIQLRMSPTPFPSFVKCVGLTPMFFFSQASQGRPQSYTRHRSGNGDHAERPHEVQTPHRSEGTCPYSRYSVGRIEEKGSFLEVRAIMCNVIEYFKGVPHFAALCAPLFSPCSIKRGITDLQMDVPSFSPVFLTPKRTKWS